MSDRLAIATKVAAFHVMRHLPAEFVSGVGSAIVRWSVPRHRPAVLADAKANLRRHHATTPDAEIELLARRFLDNVGRVMAEFALLHRLWREGRVNLDEEYRTFMAELRGPAIAIGLHKGNWEVGAALPRPGVRLASLSIIPDNTADRLIAAHVRRDLGCEVFTADRTGLRGAMEWLEKGEGPRVLSIYGDDARAGRLMAPLFGRTAHASGNLALIARLARRSGAKLALYNVTRTGGCRFTMNGKMLPPLPPGNSLVEDVALLNGFIEPIIQAHLEQWYFLDNAF